MNEALHGVKVLELSEFVSGPYCAKLMADLGADVIKVEPLAGDLARRLGPYPDDIPDLDSSGLFLYLNTNKRGVTLDLSTPSSRPLLAALVRWADVVVTNYSTEASSELGLDDATLHDLNPDLITARITPFGMNGPYKDFRAYYLNTFHGGGEGYCLPGGIGWLLYSDREPLKAAGYLGEYDVGISAACATLGALLGQAFDPELGGETIDISAQEVALDMMRYEVDSYNEGWIESRATRALPVGGLVQCQDGFVEIMPLEERMWEGLLTLMGDPDWAKEPRYAYDVLMSGFLRSQDVLGELQMEVNDFIGEWALQHTMEEIYIEGQKLGCAVGKVLGPAELFSDRQLEDRGYFVEIEHPKVGKRKYAGVPYRFSATPAMFTQPAPLLGEHNVDVYCSLLGYSNEDLTVMAAGNTI